MRRTLRQKPRPALLHPAAPDGPQGPQGVAARCCICPHRPPPSARCSERPTAGWGGPGGISDFILTAPARSLACLLVQLGMGTAVQRVRRAAYTPHTLWLTPPRSPFPSPDCRRLPQTALSPVLHNCTLLFPQATAALLPSRRRQRRDGTRRALMPLRSGPGWPAWHAWPASTALRPGQALSKLCKCSQPGWDGVGVEVQAVGWRCGMRIRGGGSKRIEFVGEVG